MEYKPVFKALKRCTHLKMHRPNVCFGALILGKLMSCQWYWIAFVIAFADELLPFFSPDVSGTCRSFTPILYGSES